MSKGLDTSVHLVVDYSFSQACGELLTSNNNFPYPLFSGTVSHVHILEEP
jgi:hypothetical protein